MKLQTQSGKKIYFASDFHLGASGNDDLAKEKMIVAWLEEIKHDASHLFLLGDIFDFWFEYHHVVPKGHIRFLGKLAEMADMGIPIYIFTGNHDMWLYDYLEKELNATVFRKPIVLQIDSKKLYIGHGDGLGPGDSFYKFLKMFFASKICQFLFSWLHPNIGFGIARLWSSKSRAANISKDARFFGNEEWIFQYCNQIHPQIQADYYVLGHRHLPLQMPLLNSESMYINIGDWLCHFSYGIWDENKFHLCFVKKT